VQTLFTFDEQRLEGLARERCDGYRTATPFPHVVIDDFLPPSVLEQVLDEFPRPDDGDWWRFDGAKERKLASRHVSMMGPATRGLFAEFNGPVFIDFLQTMTGIDGLIPDPHLFGGGLHQIERGGFLEVHADFNLHPTTGLERRLNALLYLNQGWEESWGGALELWDADLDHCVVRIPPLFNRCVVFTTSDRSFHGHPTPLEWPEGVTRKSLALYYYSCPPGDSAESVGHNTVFRERDAGEGRSRLREMARDWLPPAAVRAARRVVRRPAQK
jgi:hypothetical protein